MCPDPQILSIYLDGELPSPWKEKMEQHFDECSSCKKQFESIQQMKKLFNEDARSVNNRVEDSKERIWQKLSDRQRYSSPASRTSQIRNIRNYSLWQRKLSIPVPAAAAAILILFSAVFLMQNRNTVSNPVELINFSLASEEEIPVIPAEFDQLTDINSILQYLGTDGTDIIILQLPESKNFSRSGEPAIIKAADYSPPARRQP